MSDYERQVSIARAICTAAGHNPDQMVAPYEVLPIGPKGHVWVNFTPVPAWNLYLPEAAAAMKVLKAG